MMFITLNSFIFDIVFLHISLHIQQTYFFVVALYLT